ncbi:hypothetical protein PM082_023181 [Marasmius tenuissimus]|nr:hypothetical protein PM082_023181 [Marasmius tenuissimus]
MVDLARYIAQREIYGAEFEEEEEPEVVSGNPKREEDRPAVDHQGDYWRIFVPDTEEVEPKGHWGSRLTVGLEESPYFR